MRDDDDADDESLLARDDEEGPVPVVVVWWWWCRAASCDEVEPDGGVADLEPDDWLFPMSAARAPNAKRERPDLTWRTEKQRSRFDEGGGGAPASALLRALWAGKTCVRGGGGFGN